ncbi:MAG: hypothetical protein HYX68_27920 [Planctomycetes bacterium]|nr:hypothetical protein [Planctomycetota bacterium]
MKRTLVTLALLLLWSSAGSLRAQETPENELELVRNLRLKGWNDFARAKIDELLKRNHPTLNAALPLELARLNIAEARQKDPAQRAGPFLAARAQLEDFIKRNSGKVEAALASVELARLTSYHAQAILATAMREEDDRSRHEKARPAEVKFKQAGVDLQAALKALDAALANPANEKIKNLIAREQKRTRFDLAINVYDQARTYIDKSKDAVNFARAKTMEKARVDLVALRGDESTEVGWLANAWLMKIGMEQTTPADVNTYYEFIMKRRDEKDYQPDIQPAVRLVRYFHLQDLTLPRPEEPETLGGNAIASKAGLKPTPMQRLILVQKEGEAWLSAYPAHLKTSEGQGVLYETAMAYMRHGLMLEDAKKSPNAQFDSAIKRFDQLAGLDGDLSERARQMSMSVKFKRLDVNAELTTFDEFMMKALIERKQVIALSQELANGKGDKKKLASDRQKALAKVIRSLHRALILATPSTPVSRVDEARFYLCGAFQVSGDLHRAAIVAESLAKARASRRAAEGASTAIQIYAAMYNSKPTDQVVRQRLLDMIDFVLSPENQRAWASDTVTSMAHYHIAMANRGVSPKKAIEHLEKLSKDFIDYTYTQGQLAFIAEDARQKTDDPKEKAFYLAAAKAAINRMPRIRAATDSSSVATMYFFAKLKMPEYLYSEAMAELNAKEELKAAAKCGEMKAYVKALQDEFEKMQGVSITPGNREQLDFTIHIMLKYADLGLAEVKFRSASKDRFDQVLDATRTVVTESLKKAAATPPGKTINLRDYRVTSDILSLALRANVQKGDIVKGKAILDVLQRLADEKGVPRSGNVVGVLLNDIAGQIKRMKDGNDSTLKTTKSNYVAFLDLISKEYETKGFDNNAAMLLARAYNSLDLPSNAARLFAKVKAPEILDKVIPKKDPKATPEAEQERLKMEQELGRYWAAQIEYIRALRDAKDPASLKKAELAADAMIKHKNGRFKLQATVEKNHLIEENVLVKGQPRYREAYVGWAAFLKIPSVSGQNLANKDVQKLYFPGYFHASRTLFKVAKEDPKIMNRPKLITSSAMMAIKLEFAQTKDGWEIARPLYEKLFKEKGYEDFKKEYDRLKKERKGMSFHWPRPSGRFLIAWLQANAKPQAAREGKKS